MTHLAEPWSAAAPSSRAATGAVGDGERSSTVRASEYPYPGYGVSYHGARSDDESDAADESYDADDERYDADDERYDADDERYDAGGEPSEGYPGVEQPGHETLTSEQVLSQTWRLVQNLADTLPDDVVRFARQAVAAEDPATALAGLVFACIRSGTPLSTVEYAVLTECLLAVGDELSLLEHLTVGDVDRPVIFEFVDLPREPGIDPGDPTSDDPGAGTRRTPPREDGAAMVQAIDDAVLGRLHGPATPLGVWRAWRYPVTGAPFPPPTPVYLVEAEDDGAVLDLATAYYGAADADVGPGAPIVEIYPSGVDLPELQRAVQFSGELVHAGLRPPNLSFADVFDGEPGPDGRPQNLWEVGEDEAAHLIDYLLSGTPMLVAEATGEDVLDPSRGSVVPLHLRTDGVWVWSDASVYYLQEHLVAPPPAFYAYLRTVPPTAPRVRDVTLHHAVEWLQRW